jgi:hypothetical protein
MSIRSWYMISHLTCEDPRRADVFVVPRSGSLSTRIQTLDSIYESFN